MKNYKVQKLGINAENWADYSTTLETRENALASAAYALKNDGLRAPEGCEPAFRVVQLSAAEVEAWNAALEQETREDYDLAVATGHKTTANLCGL